ncbi:MAG: hypothetical protein UFG06_12545 [Lachnospiraceae bacterium]|nr:hypothetical protein [Lachnospiraceae bacterium]
MEKKTVKDLAVKLFKGEVTVNKRDLWLVGGICLLAGVVYGLIMAPWTRGVTIGCNNGNGWGGCDCGDCCCEEDTDN